MLPSSGYFKSVHCPFFRSGLCERPHCHFGHNKAAPSGRSVFSRCLPQTNAVDVFNKGDALLIGSIEPQILLSDYGSSENNTYIPTPVDKCVSKTASILKKTKPIKNPLSDVPEYRPTPISRLRPLSVPDSAEENSLESVPKKKKKVEEYDPATVRANHKKKVSFNLPEDEKDDCVVVESKSQKDQVPCILLESSDEEDSGGTPQFSDDELEESRASDNACILLADIKKEKINDVDSDSAVDAIEGFPLGVGDLSLVDKILHEGKKNEDVEKVHKPSSKPTSRSVEIKVEKSHKSEIRNSQKSITSNKQEGKPKKTTNQEQVAGSKSHSTSKDDKKIRDEKTHSSSKKENSLSKHTSHDKQKKTNSSHSNKPSGKTSSGQTHNTNRHDKNSTHSENRDKDAKNAVSKVKSERSVSDRKDGEKNKHSDSSKSKVSSHSSNKDSKNSSGSSKSKSHDKDVIKESKTKVNAKIQDGKISSTCPASNKKNISSHDKKQTSAQSKQKVKLKNSVETEVKSKSLSVVHKPSEKLRSVSAELKKDKEKEIQCDTQHPLQDMDYLESSVNELLSDSDDEMHLPASDSDMDSDTYEECLRIFNEDKVIREQKTDAPKEDIKEDVKEPKCTAGKKRLAHLNNVTTPTPKVPKLQPHVNPAQVMHNRYLQLQAMYARQNSTDEKKVPSSFINTKGFESYKKRITVAPCADLVAAVTQKQKLKEPGGGGGSSASHKNCSDNITYVVTEVKRIARVPSQAVKPRPIIPTEYGSKVPSNVRQRYLNNFIDECLKFSPNEDEAFQTALQEEKKAYDRSSNKTVYLNVAVNTLKRLRDQVSEVHSANPPVSSFNSSTKQPAVVPDVKMGNKTISHEMMLGGARAQRMSFSIEKKKPKIQDVEIKGKMLYDALIDYLLTTEQLLENGFPHPHPTEPGRVTISGLYHKRPASNDPFKRVCSRCQKSYQVDENGEYFKQEECDYHWGRLWQKRVARAMERQYSCCGGDSQSDGCCVSPGHVFDGDESEMLKGFVKTLPKTPPPDGYFGVYALDCEMCYTSGGIELIRVTVINPDMKPVYETFVKPEKQILDYNTRFSGITEENMQGVETSIRDVQAVLLCLFNDKTILIGHSLESDFKALKLVHNTVVDTSVVFPHKRGLPYKRALRTLMAEYMRKIIQNSLEGHDSHEDAVACMELMLWKVKEDLKRTVR